MIKKFIIIVKDDAMILCLSLVNRIAHEFGGKYDMLQNVTSHKNILIITCPRRLLPLTFHVT